jgi:hypothetical protein
MFGDDYNLSLWFGDFAAALGAYDVAWRYLERARDLQPRCVAARQKLVEIAPRTGGAREEVMARVEAAKKDFLEAQAKYPVEEETPTMKRICGGFGDLGDIGVAPVRAGLLDPDPLAGTDTDHPPPWVVEAEKAREPFVPWQPGEVEGAAGGGGGAVAARPPRAGWLPLAAAGLALVLAAATLLLVFRRRTA